MSEAEQRIAVAKFQGWQYDDSGGWHLNGVYSIDGCPPDYTCDLNEMYSVELSLDNFKNILKDESGHMTQLELYIFNLEKIVEIMCCEDAIYWFTIHASASQRCAAYLKTKHDTV